MAEAIERALYWAFRFNPCVVNHELRLRMRAGRAFLLMLTYALLASLAVVIPVFFVAWQRTHLYGSQGPGTSLGRVGLHALAYTELTLIFIALPAYAAATIAAEREKRTLEMLRATLVTPADVVTGKLLVVVAFAAVLLGATVPAAAWCVLMGGVGPSDVIHVFTYLFAVAVAVSALGVLLSARFQRSLGATVATYAVLLGLGVLSVLVIYAVSMVTMISRHASSPPAMGSAAALGLIAVPVLVTAWLLLLAVRWFLGRLPLLSRLRGSKVMAVIVFLAAAGLVAWQASELVTKTSHATPMVLILVNPYAGIGAILEEEWARGIISSSTPPGSTTPATDLTSYVWSVMVLNTAVFALAFWALAVRQVRRKSAWGPPTAAHSNEN